MQQQLYRPNMPMQQYMNIDDVAVFLKRA